MAIVFSAPASRLSLPLSTTVVKVVPATQLILGGARARGVKIQKFDRKFHFPLEALSLSKTNLNVFGWSHLGKEHPYHERNFIPLLSMFSLPDSC